MNFTYPEYFRFMCSVRADGYEIRPFDRPGRITSPDERVLLNRHDVDISLADAVAFAAFEHEFEIKATYFVLTTSPFYNAASAPCGRQIRELVRLGHEIGLHHDWSVTHDYLRSVRLLEEIAEVDIGTISFHKPHPEFVRSKAELTFPLLHTYSPYYLRTIDYCSDSSRQWRYGPPEERSALRDGKALHLCTHPESWLP